MPKLKDATGAAPRQLGPGREVGRETYHTADAVAVFLGLHVRTVRRWIAEGKIKSVRVGKRIYIPRVSVEGLFRAE